MGAQEFKHCSVVSGKFLDFFFKLIMIILRTMTKNHNPKKNVNTEIFTYQRLLKSLGTPRINYCQQQIK